MFSHVSLLCWMCPHGRARLLQAGEPLFTALFSALFLGQIFALPVYAALLPVVGGVAIASLKELSFT